MKVTEAKYTRKFNLGDYESEEHSLVAQVEDGETGSEVLISLKEEVIAAHTGEKVETKPVKAKQTKEKKNATKPKASVVDDEDTDDEDTTDEDAGIDGEGDQDDEATDDQDGDDSDDSSEDSEDGEEPSEEGDDEEEQAPAKGKRAPSKAGAKSKEASPAKAKGFRKKPQAYDRNIEQHKEIFSGVLRSVAPDWKKSEITKTKAKKASEAMVGNAFLDENGEVIPEFTAKVKKLMTVKK